MAFYLYANFCTDSSFVIMDSISTFCSHGSINLCSSGGNNCSSAICIEYMDTDLPIVSAI